MILDKKKIIRFDVANGALQQDPFHNFNTKAYLAGQDEGLFSGVDASGQIVSSKPSKTNMLGQKPLKDYSKSKKKDQKRYKVTMEDGVLLPDYRLPTEAEWEYACQANIGETQFDNVEQNKVYSWNDYTIRIKNGKEKDRGKIRLNVMRAKGDNAGLAGGNLNDAGIITTPVFSYYPNAYGLYNMNGNVSEWVMDVYRPLTNEDKTDFRSFRGNVFKTKVLNDEGQIDAKLEEVLKDTVTGQILGLPGQVKWRNVDVEKDNLNERRNYRRADNINELDGDIQSQVTDDWKAKPEPEKQESDGMYKYGATSMIDDKSHVYKGGSWKDRVYYMNPGTRRFLDEKLSTDYIGFRCAMTRVGSPVGLGAPKK
jgi:gliding motility-associated lipoprotein GldJ